MCSLSTVVPQAAARDCEQRAGVQKSLEVLEHEICTLAARLASQTCRWLCLVAEFDAREGWAEWGVNSCAEWLSWRCGIAISAAREHTRVARVLGGLALVRAAFASGALSYSKVRALTRVASASTEAQLVELARHATGAQLERLCGQYRRVLRASSEHAIALSERQALDLYWDQDGMLVFHGRLTAEDGAVLMAALHQAAQQLPAAVRQLGGAAARAQALTVLAAGGQPAAEVVVHVDAQTLPAGAIKDRCELAGGPALAPETMRRLGCDAALVTIIEHDGKPLSVGRRTRVIPPALRRALQSRDHGCRFPGPTHSHHLHAHHIKHWAHGGPTEIDNLLQLCSHHHRLVHEAGYHIKARGGGEPQFYTPDGRPIPQTCTAPPLPATSTLAATAATAATAAWDELPSDQQPSDQQPRDGQFGPDTCRPLSAGDQLDYNIAIEGLTRLELGPETSQWE